jgi:hypothetical protein
VLLVGGSSRIPMVAHLVSAELGRPTSVDTHPKHAIALGAAAVGADRTGVGAAAIAATALGRLTPSPADKATLAEESAPVLPLAAGAAAPALAAPAGDRLGRLRWWRRPSASSLAHDGHDDQDPRQPSDDQSPTHPRQRRLPLVIGVLVLVAVLAGGGTAAYRALAASTPTTNHQPLVPVSHQSSDTRRTPASVIAPSTPIARTTVAPTTVAPTTVAPTTVAPTTVAPTTVAPTTVAPTTVAPTTVAPTTVAPTTPITPSTPITPTTPITPNTPITPSTPIAPSGQAATP